MNAFPWLRLYNETLSDRKIARICRDAGQPKALVIGVWATLLMLASESPVRGELLISEDLPLSPDEIRDETGLDADTFDAIIGGLASYALIDTSGPCWAICNWDKRQPASDSSAERVRQHRERQRNVTPPLPPNGNAPLQKRYSNVLDREEDKDRDKEGEGESGAIAPPPAVPAFAPVPEAVKQQKARRGIVEPEPAVTTTAPAIVRLLNRLTSYWPGEDVTPALVNRFGETPDEPALSRAVELWRMSGHKVTNWLGIADWYDELRRRPDWTPQDRFKNGNGRANGQPVAPAVVLKELSPGLY